MLKKLYWLLFVSVMGMGALEEKKLSLEMEGIESQCATEMRIDARPYDNAIVVTSLGFEGLNGLFFVGGPLPLALYFSTAPWLYFGGSCLYYGDVRTAVNKMPKIVTLVTASSLIFSSMRSFGLALLPFYMEGAGLGLLWSSFFLSASVISFKAGSCLFSLLSERKHARKARRTKTRARRAKHRVSHL